MSSLARGKWIEAHQSALYAWPKSGLPSQEGSGLKHESKGWYVGKNSLPSQEGSGLKQSDQFTDTHPGRSSLARGKWIEALIWLSIRPAGKVFPRKREVD